MAISIVMPALEMAQETGKIIAWLKQEGDTVTKGEPILEIETDKAVVEFESPGDGVLAGIRSGQGDVVQVGSIIAWIVAPGETPPVEEAPVQTGRAITATKAAVPAASAPANPGEIRISPKARRLAKEKGIDITAIRGTGPDGMITAEDVEATAPAVVASAPESALNESALSTIARLMGERTTASWTQVPHFFLVREVDVTGLVRLREKLGPTIERDRGVKLTYTDLLVSVVARIVAKHPKMNASWSGGGIRLNASVNISVAMAVKDGVVGAVIRGAETADLSAIAVMRKELTDRARAGRLRPQDISNGTFTISNLGMYEVDAFTAIITQPQTAVLALGRIADRVVPVNGEAIIRPILTMTLSSDHRVVDGAQAASFLKELAEALGSPDGWV